MRKVDYFFKAEEVLITLLFTRKGKRVHAFLNRSPIPFSETFCQTYLLYLGVYKIYI